MACVHRAIHSSRVLIQSKYSNIADYLFRKCDPTPLAIFRFLFGFLMVLDVPQERGLEEADLRFGDPNYCFFPLFSFVQPLKLNHVCILYSIMWLGSLGIMLGIRFRTSCFLYLIPYTYFLLLDKSRWNNHSYLFGLTVLLLAWSDAGNYLSVDNHNQPRKKAYARKWNYFMIKFQLFILYFFAAVKKFDADWIHGYSMRNLTQHWVFEPIKSILDEELIEFYMIHLGGLLYDLTVGFMLNIQFTKKLAFFLSFMFHGLNSQIFTIGMFPYVCLASLVIFCEPHEFPCNLFSIRPRDDEKKRSEEDLSGEDEAPALPKKRRTHKIRDAGTQKKLPRRRSTIDSSTEGGERRHWWKVMLMGIYILIQLFLPFSHFITKGYNNWTEGLYGYSWDMMVYSWNTLHIKVTVVDLDTGWERYLDPDVWVTNDRWSSHADMAKQYSQCIARNLANANVTDRVEVYLDVWKSLNGRFQQRVFDPRVNILEAPWSPWEPVPWVLPLLKQYSNWRKEHFFQIARNVANWTASSNVIFVADYPDMFLENYMPPELANVTVTLLRGDIVIELESVTLSPHVSPRKYNVTLSGANPGFQSLQIPTGCFHRIYTVSPTPSCYMYTYTNSTIDRMEAETQGNKTNASSNQEQLEDETSITVRAWTQINEFIQDKIDVFARSIYLISNSYLNLMFDVPMIIRRVI